MQHRFLLYIDILGFSQLVSGEQTRIDDLYEVIASLNVHRHDAFRCVIFSDTILVYNVDGGDVPEDKSYLIMYLCEFAKDLLHRLTNRGIVFRAVITEGYFRHYQLNEVPCFYGSALVKAYEAEKKIKAIGLFLQKDLVQFSDIFHTTDFNDDFEFVYVTQALDEIEQFCCENIDGAADYLESTDAIWQSAPELIYISDLLKSLQDNLPEDVLTKYLATVDLYRQKYPKIVACLERNGFNISSVIPSADWQKAIDRHPESCTYAIKDRKEF